ncbi:MAG: type II and III secretion system protein family protein, partial [Nitrospiria bacterium]
LSRIDEIREMLREFNHLTVVQKRNKIFVRGIVQSESENLRLLHSLEAYPKVINQVEVSKEKSFKNIEEEIRNLSRFPLLEVHVAEERIILKGDVYDESARVNVEKIAGSYGKAVVNLIHVSRPMVEMDVKIVQIDTDEGDSYGGNLLKNLGVSIDTTAGPESKPSVSLSTNALTSLNLLVNHGKAKILSEPHLTCRSGEHATFHSGGEIGFRVSGNGNADVKFKEYGLILNIEPHVIDRETIESHISLEVSSPTSSPTSAQDVGFVKFNTDSQIISQINETIIIAGLAENIEHRFQENTPLLGNIPVLNLFFSQKQDKNSRKDLLMMVTPAYTRVEKNEDYRPQAMKQKEELENRMRNGEVEGP